MALFRICQEALSNIAKYAQADEVRVELNRVEEALFMTIEDNGIGIAPADKIKPNSFGLRGMQERAAAFGGECYIESPVQGNGTLIRIQAPVRTIA
jgi:signal transduction histidine kinase